MDIASVSEHITGEFSLHCEVVRLEVAPLEILLAVHGHHVARIGERPSALILRGTASEIVLPEWLVNQLDQPANQRPHAPVPHEYRPSGTVDDLVRVFFLTHAQSPQHLQQIATEVRTTAEIKQIFTYNALCSLIARGTAAQIASADRLIAERDQ